MQDTKHYNLEVIGRVACPFCRTNFVIYISDSLNIIISEDSFLPGFREVHGMPSKNHCSMGGKSWERGIIFYT